MEKWQKNYVTRNLPELIEAVHCDTILLSILLSEGIISALDLDKLILAGISYGKLEQARLLLAILETRVQGYEILTRVLYKCKQTGAVLILLNGFNEQGISNPFEICNISFDLEKLLSCNITFQGYSCSFEDVFAKIERTELELIFKQCLNGDLYSKLAYGCSFPIGKNHIPPALSYYVERCLSIRKYLKPTIFYETRQDIFVFQDMEMHQLTELAFGPERVHPPKMFEFFTKVSDKNHLTGLSSQQRHRITCRFILLEHYNHFQQIVEIANTPVHWIKFDNGKYQLVASTTGFSEIMSYLLDEETIYSEYKFLEAVQTSKSICILDSPGMGKSVLLASLARKIKQMCPHTIVVFVKISNLLQDMNDNNFNIDAITVKEKILSIVSDSKVVKTLFSKMLFSSKYKTDLFLDGFDEVLENQETLAKHLLRFITENFVNTRLFVTSRAHKCKELEENLKCYSYSIQPFQKSNQIDFLVSYWKSHCNLSDLDALKLFNLAFICLNHLDNNVSSNDVQQNIAGIPLQCKLLGDVYLEDAVLLCCAPLSTSVNDFSISNHCRSIFDMYKAHIEKSFSVVSSEAEKAKQIEYHIYEAFKLLFPEYLSKYVPDIPETSLLTVGLMETTNASFVVHFVHRTFAEYLVALFLARNIYTKTTLQLPSWINRQFDFISLFFETSIKCNEYKISMVKPYVGITSCKFSNTTISYFLDKLLGYYEIDKCDMSFQLCLQNSHFLNSITFFKKLSASLSSNSRNVYMLLKEAYMTPDFYEMVVEDDLYWENAVLVAAIFSEIDLFKDCCEMVEAIKGRPLNELAFPLLKYQLYEVTPLHIAVTYGRYHIFEYLVAKCKDSELSNWLIHTCVNESYTDSKSVINSKLQVLKALVKMKPELLEQRESWLNRTPVLMDNINFKLLEYLILQNSCLTNIMEISGKNLAHISVDYLSPEEFHVLCLYVIGHDSANIFLAKDCIKNSMCTPLHCAFKSIKLLDQTIELLANAAGLTFNEEKADGVTEFLCAIMNKQKRSVIELMTRHGADWKRSFKNRNVLHLTVENPELLELFLALGIDVDSKTENGATSLMLTMMKASEESMLTAKLLVENGACVNAIGPNRMTPLHMAAFNNHNPIERVSYLLEKGADCNAKMKKGVSFLHLSVFDNRKQASELRKKFVEFGANVNAKTNGDVTPLHFAIASIQENDYEQPVLSLITFLLENGASVNATTTNGYTPLHCASIIESESIGEIITVLVENGANVNAVDLKNRTPLYYAKSRKNDAAVILKNFGAKLSCKSEPPVNQPFQSTSHNVNGNINNNIDSDSEEKGFFSVEDWLEEAFETKNYSTWKIIKRWFAKKYDIENGYITDSSDSDDWVDMSDMDGEEDIVDLDFKNKIVIHQ